MSKQQLVARIKRSSKYSHQAPRGEWFDVSVYPDVGGHSVEGNDNRYRLCDVALGVRMEDGDVFDIATGKRVKVAEPA